jgi:hypothetical protein
MKLSKIYRLNCRFFATKKFSRPSTVTKRVIKSFANMKYVAIEGGCYAGKTTTIEYLSNKGMVALPELRMSDGLPPGASLPAGLEGYKAKIDAVIKAEEKRTEKVDTLRSRTTTLLADRGILSATLVSQDIGVRLGLGDSEDRKRAFEYGATQLVEARSAGRIVLPDAVLVMILTDSDEFYRRAEERGPDEVPGYPWTLYEPNYLSAERSYTYANAIWGDSAAKIEVRGGDEQKQSVGAVALELVRNLPPAGKELVLPNEMLQD